MPSLSLVASLYGHTGTVWSVAWSPLGHLATCGTDRTICIWCPSEDKNRWYRALSFNDGTFLRTIRDLSWSSDGRSLACGCFDALTFVLELVGGREPRLEATVSLEGHDSEVKGVCYSSGGALLATCSRDRSVWIWEAGLDFDYECIAVLNGHSADIKSVVWHPNIELLVSCCYDGTMRVWVEDEDDWFCSETLAAQSGTVWSASFDAEGKGLVSVAEDGSLVVWSREDPPGGMIGAQPCFTVVARVEAVHDGAVYCVDWNKSNGLIVTCGGDDAMNILRKVDKEEPRGGGRDESNSINAPTEAFGRPAISEDQITSFDQAGNGKQNGTSGGEEEVVTTKLTQDYKVIASVPRAHTGDVNRVAWHPTEPTLLASCGDDGVVRIWRYNEEDRSSPDT